MGKVASSSIYETIKSLLPFNSIYHVHYLTEKNMQWRKEFTNNPATSVLENHVRKKIERNKNKTIKIISIVRDITIRDISMIFQNLKSFNPDKNWNEYSLNEIEQLHENLDQDLSLDWFKNEFQEFSGFNIYENSFDKEKGYSIFHYNNYDILIIKLEKLNDCYRAALQKFTGIVFKQLLNINETADKKEAEFYQYVKSNIKVSPQRLEKNYTSTLMKHFYTDTEIALFKQKWNSRN
ncbi:MAG: hypothetical protein JXB17_02220 [Bacteroidales bacterium]|nr:hypothetical protein [Bacteroidales bacterium]